jgi:hypothetical protein
LLAKSASWPFFRPREMTDDRVDSLLCPESYLRESFGSMLFRAQPLGYGGKLVPIEV